MGRATVEPPRRLCLVGGGMAGVHFLRRLRARPGSWRITVFEQEAGPPYDRLRLSSALAGPVAGDELVLEPFAWFSEAGIELRDRCRIVRLDPRRRSLEDEYGRHHAFDVCVLATGSLPLRPPIPGMELGGVSGLRTLDDARALAGRATPGASAVVIGGGFLGVEVASALSQRGMAVTIVHLADRLVERHLDVEAAAMLQAALERRGISCRLGQIARSLAGDRQVEAVVLKGGEMLDASLVVVCVGVRPNVSLARAAGLRVGRAVLVDDQLRTSEPGVYAIGECSEHRGRTFGLVGPAYEQADVLVQHLSGNRQAGLAPSEGTTTLRAAGVDLFAGGHPGGHEDDRSERLADAAAGVYKRMVFRDDILVGAILFGDLTTRAAVVAALGHGSRVGTSRELLVGGDAIAALRDDEPVCGCRGVTRGDLMTALGSGCRTCADVVARTGAGRSCGSCLTSIEQLVAAAATTGSSTAK